MIILHMMRVISSPSSSTRGVSTRIFCMGASRGLECERACQARRAFHTKWGGRWQAGPGSGSPGDARHGLTGTLFWPELEDRGAGLRPQPGTGPSARNREGSHASGTPALHPARRCGAGLAGRASSARAPLSPQSGGASAVGRACPPHLGHRGLRLLLPGVRDHGADPSAGAAVRAGRSAPPAHGPGPWGAGTGGPAFGSGVRRGRGGATCRPGSARRAWP